MRVRNMCALTGMVQRALRATCMTLTTLRCLVQHAPGKIMIDKLFRASSGAMVQSTLNRSQWRQRTSLRSAREEWAVNAALMRRCDAAGSQPLPSRLQTRFSFPDSVARGLQRPARSA